MAVHPNFRSLGKSVFQNGRDGFGTLKFQIRDWICICFGSMAFCFFRRGEFGETDHFSRDDIGVALESSKYRLGAGPGFHK
mmetsp:Transcript_12734/g.51269  ORF Transcript_12734/g.51269 Transcript_12734/m.51269 type:complete len:81 (-) Transcript_12734:809-1051(-)